MEKVTLHYVKERERKVCVRVSVIEKNCDREREVCVCVRERGRYRCVFVCVSERDTEIECVCV